MSNPYTQALREEARALRADPSRFNNRGGYARNAQDIVEFPESPNAVCWCSFGFVQKVHNEVAPGDAFRYRKATETMFDVLCEEIDPIHAREFFSVPNWNDTYASPEQVADLLDRTADRLEGQA